MLTANPKATTTRRLARINMGSRPPLPRPTPGDPRSNRDPERGSFRESPRRHQRPAVDAERSAAEEQPRPPIGMGGSADVVVPSEVHRDRPESLVLKQGSGEDPFVDPDREGRGPVPPLPVSRVTLSEEFLSDLVVESGQPPVRERPVPALELRDRVRKPAGAPEIGPELPLCERLVHRYGNDPGGQGDEAPIPRG